MSGESDKICKDGASASSKSNDSASKSNIDDVCDVIGKLQNMSTTDMSTADVSVCANCGKEGNDIKNTCNKCKKATYCNAVCKKVHKKKHKKDCEEHVRQAAMLHDEELFKQPSPQYGDCPICFERIPILDTGSRYKTCCGKTICSGCSYAPVYDNQGNKIAEKVCAFCRTPTPYTNEEAIEREKKRMEAGDAIAIYNLGVYYAEGLYGFPQDYAKALELWHRAGELGYAVAYNNIGLAYNRGYGVDVDMEKAIYFWELAAMSGDATARHNLGIEEEDAGNTERALKHYMISLRDGDADSLTAIQRLYTNRHATKDDYMKALQSYQEYLGEIKSKQRDEAAAANEELYRYY